MAVRDDFAPGEVLAAADLNDTFASKLPYSYGTATPSTTDSGFLWYDSNSTPAAPKFWDGAAFQALTSGKILQVSVGATSTRVTTTSSTYIDSGLSATITPTKTTSSVLVIVMQNGISKTTATTNARAGFKLLQGATEILGQQTVNWLQGTDLDIGRSWTVAYLDTPATTSSLTYKTQFNNINNSGTIEVQDETNRSAMILMEIAA